MCNIAYDQIEIEITIMHNLHNDYKILTKNERKKVNNFNCIFKSNKYSTEYRIIRTKYLQNNKKSVIFKKILSIYISKICIVYKKANFTRERYISPDVVNQWLHKTSLKNRENGKHLKSHLSCGKI